MAKSSQGYLQRMLTIAFCLVPATGLSQEVAAVPPAPIGAIALDENRVFVAGNWERPALHVVAVPAHGPGREWIVHERLFRRPGGTYGPGGQGSGTEAMVAKGSTVYAALADGVLIVDVSAPDAPRVLSTFDQRIPGGSMRSLAVSGDLLIATGGRGVPRNRNVSGGVALVDVSDPAEPIQVGTIELPQGSDNVQSISMDGSVAFLAARRSGLLIYDVSNPEAPTLLSRYAPGSWTRGVAVRSGFAYLAVSTTVGSSWLHVLDVGDPRAPRLVSTLDTPGVAQEVEASTTHLYLAAREAGLRIYDIRAPHAPEFSTRLDSGGHASHVRASESLVAVWGFGGGRIFRALR